MTFSRRFLAPSLLAGVALLGIVAARGFSDEKSDPVKNPPKVAPPRLDIGKSMRIERPITDIVKNNGFTPNGGFPVAQQQKFQPRLDRGKLDVIEPQVEALLRAQHLARLAEAHRLAVAAATPAPAPAPAPKKDGFVNPKVEPGKVRWHASYAAAQEAAKKSKKPVLLFQLMGKLDDQFC